MLDTAEAATEFTPSEARIAPSGDPRIDSLRFPEGWVWGTKTITYSFFAGGSYYGSESNPQPVSIAAQNNVRYIFEEILQPLVDLTFVEVTDTPTSYGLMRFLASTSPDYAYARPPYAGDTNTGSSIDVAGDVVLNPRYDVATGDQNALNNSFQSGPGSHGFTALIHEIGHALGLKHPFDDSPTLPTSQDNQDNTVMTYTFKGRSPAMPMPYDVLALQYFYGENQTARIDDTTYVFTAVDAFTPGSGSGNAPSALFGRTKQLLWDFGGQDIMDFSQLPSEAGGYRFDGRPGGWITTNSAYNSVAYSGSNFVTDFGTRIALSGTSIENIVVSTSDDTIFLNDQSNRVSGYAPGIAGGNDVVHDSGAADTLDLSRFARAAVTESRVGDDLRLDLGVTGTVTVADYFSATTESRMRILYEPDGEVLIAADPVSLRVGQTAIISFTLGMSTTNFTVEDVTVSGGTLTSFTGSGSAYSALFTPQPNFEGTATIGVAAGVFTNDQGTTNLAASVDLSIDTIQPTVSIGRGGSGTVLLGGSELVTFTLSEAATDFALDAITVTGGLLSGFTGSGASYTATFVPAPGFLGTATIVVPAGVFTDGAGNPNLAAGALVIAVDTVAPTISLTRPGSGTLIGGATETLTFTLSVATTDFTAADVTVAGGTLSGFNGSGADYTATFTPLMGFQGTASVTVPAGAFTSVVGNPNEAATLAIPVDTVPPSLTITRSGSGPLTIGATALITFTISEPGTTFNAGVIATSGGSLSGFSGSGSVYSATFTPAPDFEGTASITVAPGIFSDQVGYTNSSASLSLTVDTVAPTVALSISGPSSLKVGDTATVTFMLSEPSSNFTVDDITVTGGTITTFTGSGSSYLATFVPAANFRGTATISVLANRFTDQPGNGNLGSAVTETAVDTLAPTVMITRSGSDTVAIGMSDTVFFTLSEPANDFSAADVAVIGGSIRDFAGAGSDYSATFLPEPAFQGGAVITVGAATFTNQTGNPNVASSLSVPVDTLRPTVSLSRSGSGILKGGETAIITFAASEPIVGLTAADISASGGSISGLTGSGGLYSAVFTPTAGFEGFGVISVAAGTFTDIVGNANVAGGSLSFPVDTIAPTITLTRAGAGTLKIGDTVSLAFTASEAITDFTTDDVFVVGGTISNVAGSGTAYTATFTPAESFDGTARVRVRANRITDLAGNPNTATNILLLDVDTVAPRVLGFRASASHASLRIGDSIGIEAELSEPAAVIGSTFTIRLNSGGHAVLTVDRSGVTARGVYTAQPGEESGDLEVIEVIPDGGVRDAAGNTIATALPSATMNLAAGHEIVVDAAVKFVGLGGFNTDPLLVRDVRNQFRTIPLRFTTPVSGVSTASLTLSVDGQPVPLRGARVTGSGTSFLMTLPVSRFNPVGIYKLSVIPGAIRATSNSAAAIDNVSLYWGFQKSMGMVPGALAQVAVQHVIQTGQRASAVIGWRPPSAGAGGPITQYQVEYRVVGTARWIPVRSRIPGSATSTEISGVAIGKSYEFRVAAMNAAGRGDFASSGPINLAAMVRLHRPAAPTNRRA